MKIVRIGLIALSASALPGCAYEPHQDVASDARLIVEPQSKAFSASVVAASGSGWATGDVESLVALYSHDAILFPPDGPMIKGREEIRRYWSRGLDRRILKHQVTVERAEYSGALLYEYGSFSGTFEINGVVKDATARYISVWRRDANGLWLKHLDTWW